MILLDTNVLSEPMRPAPEHAVVNWLDRQDPATLFVSAVTLTEMRFGIAQLPEGRRRQVLHDLLETTLVPQFQGRVLEFTDAISRVYADRRRSAQEQGIAVTGFDALIAATAVAHGLIVATRDVTPFVAMGVPVINPFLK